MPITAGDGARTRRRARRRARQVSAHLSTMGEEFASIGVQLGARYDGSPIVAEDGAPPADDYVRYTPSGVPGGRAPHYWPGQGRGYGDSLFDRFGKGFTLLRLGGKAADTSSIEAAARRRGVPLTVLDLPAADARDLYGRDLALIRPDQYVAWRGDAPPADADSLIARLVGASLSACCHARRRGKLTFGGRLGNQGRKIRPAGRSRGTRHVEDSCP